MVDTPPDKPTQNSRSDPPASSAEAEPKSSQSTPAPAQKRPGSALKDTVTVAGGSAIAQALAVLAAPILTRFYPPEEFGTAAIFMSLTGMLILISCMRYELAILLPDRDEDAASIFTLCILIVGVFAILAAVLLGIGGAAFVQALNAPDLQPLLWLVPLAILIGGPFTALNYWTTRKRAFKLVAIARITRTLTVMTIQITLGITGLFGAGGLIFGQVAGSGGQSTALAIPLFRRDLRFIVGAVRWQSIWNCLVRYRKFPAYNAPATLLNALAWQVPTFLLAFYFSPIVVGFYALGNRLMRVPMDMLGRSVRQVFFQRASVAVKDGTLSSLVEETFGYLVKLSLLPLLVLSIVGAEVFSALFGAEWREAGVYSQILAIWTCVWFISSPMSALYSVLEKQEMSLLINFFVLVSRIIALVIGGYTQDARLTLALFSVSGILVYGYLAVAIMRIAGVSMIAAGRVIMRYGLISVPIAAALLFLIARDANPWLITIISGVIVAAYYLIVFHNDPRVRRLLKRRGVAANS